MSSQKITRKYQFKVYLYVYDLSDGDMKILSPSVLGCNVNGLWHSSVVIRYKPYPTEYFFSYQTGKSGCRLGSYNNGMKPIRKIYMGSTEIKPIVFREYLKGIEHRYRSQDYRLMSHNCNSFSNELCQFLLGKEIPDYIKNICTEVSNTPAGQEYRPLVEFLNTIEDDFKKLF